jgi:hypothetical protein
LPFLSLRTASGVPRDMDQQRYEIERILGSAQFRA